MTVTNLRQERDKRNRQRLIIEAQRRRHSQDVRRQRRQIANGAAAQGCSTMITVALLAGLTVVAAAWRWAR